MLLNHEADTAAFFGKLGKLESFPAAHRLGPAGGTEGDRRRSTKPMPRLGKLCSAKRLKPGEWAATALGDGRDVHYGAVLGFGLRWTSSQRQRAGRRFGPGFQRIPSSSSTTYRLSAHNSHSAAMILRRPSSFFKEPVPMNWEAAAHTLYPVYIRGEAYLSSHQGNQAAASFKKSSTIAGLLE